MNRASSTSMPKTSAAAKRLPSPVLMFLIVPSREPDPSSSRSDSAISRRPSLRTAGIVVAQPRAHAVVPQDRSHLPFQFSPTHELKSKRCGGSFSRRSASFNNRSSRNFTCLLMNFSLLRVELQAQIDEVLEGHLLDAIHRDGGNDL